MNSVISILRMIKFSHTIFALPFAVVSFVVNTKDSSKSFSISTIIFILLALVFARSLAMAFNRLVDYKYDKENPRTKDRELVRGELSKKEVILFIIASSFGFILSTYFINDLSFYLSFVLIILLFLYSYLKRFTFLVHFYLGMVIGFVPIGVDIALNSSISLSSIALFVALAFWIAGFDIIYSLFDLDFDKDFALYSLPAFFGIKKSLLISKISYLFMIIALTSFGIINNLNSVYYYGLLGIFILLASQHILIKVYELGVINKVLFSLNGVISILYLVVFLLDFV